MGTRRLGAVRNQGLHNASSEGPHPPGCGVTHPGCRTTHCGQSLLKLDQQSRRGQGPYGTRRGQCRCWTREEAYCCHAQQSRKSSSWGLQPQGSKRPNSSLNCCISGLQESPTSLARTSRMVIVIGTGIGELAPSAKASNTGEADALHAMRRTSRKDSRVATKAGSARGSSE